MIAVAEKIRRVVADPAFTFGSKLIANTPKTGTGWTWPSKARGRFWTRVRCLVQARSRGDIAGESIAASTDRKVVKNLVWVSAYDLIVTPARSRLSIIKLSHNSFVA